MEESLRARANINDPSRRPLPFADLTRYVRQTMPATVPADSEKPVMAKPFYRAYDIGVF